MEQQAKLVEQYKQELLAQARRGGVQAAAPVAQAQATAQAQAVAEVKVISPSPSAPGKVTAAEHVERVLERAEPIVVAVEPFAEIALHSGLAAAGAAAAAKGIELGVEALEEHIENKKAHAAPPPAPPAPPPPPAPAPVVDINFTQQIEQTAPAVVAPTITAPTVIAPTVVAPAAVVQPAPVPAPPPPAPPVMPPAPPPPVHIPVPVPLPPAPPPVYIQPLAPPPPASILIPPVPVPVAVPVQPAPIPVVMPAQTPPAPAFSHPCAPAPIECETITHTVTAASCRRPAKPCPIHNPSRQPCRAACKPPAPRPCACKSPRATPQTEETSWFMQPAVEAAYAAYTVGMAPQEEIVPDVAYAGQSPVQNSYYELPMQGYASLDDYLARNTARGILELQVRVASDSGAPVPGANVDVLKAINGVTYLFYHGVTDANGSAGRISLPAPDRSLSFAPPRGFVPYATYTVSVAHGDYAPQVLENVTVFPDTESLQVVRLGMAATPPLVDEGRYVM